MPPKLVAQSEQTLAVLRVENPEKLTEEFLKEMDPLLLKPEDFMQKWAEFFRELSIEGEVYEEAVRKKMRELKDCVVPQLLSAWLFAPDGAYLQAHAEEAGAPVARCGQALSRVNCAHPHVRSVLHLHDAFWRGWRCGPVTITQIPSAVRCVGS
jgi:hypothetical protein